MKKVVVDSSVIVKWLNSQDEKYLKQADKILTDCEKRKVSLYAPELAKYEVGNALLFKELDPLLAKTSLSVLYSLPITFVPLSEENGIAVLEIADKNKITYYDAVFINLAKKTKAILVTANPKHLGKIADVKVVPIEHY